MKILISDFALLDLEAPTVAAYAIPHETGVAWGVWCRCFEKWQHGIRERHETPIAKATRPTSWYNLAFTGDALFWLEPPQ